jgi:hypothetical protein
MKDLSKFGRPEPDANVRAEGCAVNRSDVKL